MPQFEFPNQSNFYQGKVRDVYSIGDDLLVMVASDRISAFDVVLPRTIPFKGQVLNQLAAFMLQQTASICRNWLLGTPAPTVSVGYRCIPYKVEVVVRGNMCGHAWRTYSGGQRILCGQLMPDGLIENDFFPQPMVTPSTKASEGHDEDITAEEIIRQGLVPADEWSHIEAYAQQLFSKGAALAQERGLILADTKYEFGKRNGEIVLMDEIHTPDSSRYFYYEGFGERQSKGERQAQLSKEFVREWLIQNEFMGKEGQVVPEMTDQWVETISKKYIELFEKVTGQHFHPQTIDEEKTFCDTVRFVKASGASSTSD